MWAKRNSRNKSYLDLFQALILIYYSFLIWFCFKFTKNTLLVVSCIKFDVPYIGFFYLFEPKSFMNFPRPGRSSDA